MTQISVPVTIALNKEVDDDFFKILPPNQFMTFQENGMFIITIRTSLTNDEYFTGLFRQKDGKLIIIYLGVEYEYEILDERDWTVTLMRNHKKIVFYQPI